MLASGGAEQYTAVRLDAGTGRSSWGDQLECGALAQLGERYNGIVEVSGSIPLGSTTRSVRFGFIGVLPALADEVSSAGVFGI